MIRASLGILAGGVVWYVAFFTVAWLLLLGWPAYAAAVEAFVSPERYDFTPAMSGLHIVMWALSEILAGWVAVVVARRGHAAWVLAALLMALMSFMHLYWLWDRIPWWYNLAVVATVVPCVLLGGSLAGGFTERRAVAAGAS